jgi:RimJ/RimL family protein N-acetyltransferase
MDDLTPVRLRDGTLAVIVPLLPANREALEQEYERLSPETRFGRFLTAMPRLSEQMLEHLVDEVDQRDHVALILLVIAEDGTEVPAGLARIIRYHDDPTAADLAVTVVDEWQGRGVATALLEALMPRRPAGVRRIVTEVSATNAASQAMLRRLGEVEVRPDGPGVLDVVVELPDDAGEPPDLTAGSPGSSRRPARPGGPW